MNAESENKQQESTIPTIGAIVTHEMSIEYAVECAKYFLQSSMPNAVDFKILAIDPGRDVIVLKRTLSNEEVQSLKSSQKAEGVTQ